MKTLVNGRQVDNSLLSVCRPWFQNRRFLLLSLACLIFYAAVRLTAYSVFLDPIRLPDTEAFLGVASKPLGDGGFWAGPRPFVVPSFYKIFGSRLDLVMWVQIGLHIVSWVLLALALSKVLRRLILKVVAPLIVLLFGIAPSVVELDRLMLSETFSVSGVALILAGALLVVSRLVSCSGSGTRRQLILIASLWGVLCVLWCFTHDLNSYFVLLTAALLTLPLLIRSLRKAIPVQFFAIGAASLLISFLVSASLMNRAERWRFPLTNVIAQRVLPYPERLEFFKRHGLPTSPELMQYSGGWASSNHDGMQKIPSFQEWLSQSGKQTYIRFLLMNPRYMLASLWNNIPAIASGNYSYLYEGKHALRASWPKLTDRVLHPRGFAVLLFACGAIVCIGFSCFLTRTPRAWLLSSVILWLFLGSGFQIVVAYHGDEMEISRHTLVPLITLRLASWLAVLFSADLLLSRGSSQAVSEAVMTVHAHKGDKPAKKHRRARRARN